MPLCAEHGQVYGEGSACVVCSGGEVHHEAQNVPQQLSHNDKTALEDMLAFLQEQVAVLHKRVDALEGK